jgi:hypothetical protein
MYGIKIRPGHWNLHLQWADQTHFVGHKYISMLAVAWVMRLYWRFFSGVRKTALPPLNRI